MPCASASCLPTGPTRSLIAVAARDPEGCPRATGGVRLHSPECDCPTCEHFTLGEFAYREIAEELGSGDPEVLDPIRRARSDARITAYRSRRIEPTAALLLLVLPERRYAAA